VLRKRSPHAEKLESCHLTGRVTPIIIDEKCGSRSSHFCWCSTLCCSWRANHSSNPKLEAQLKRLFLTATTISPKDGMPPHFKVFGERPAFWQ
jgi:hypothetical protein